MTIIHWEYPDSAPPQLTGDVNGGIAITVPTWIYSNDKDDGPGLVENYIRQNIRDYGEPYVFGNESNDFAVLRQIQAGSRIGADGIINSQPYNHRWMANLIYGPTNNEQSQTENRSGNHEEDPLQYRPIVEPDFGTQLMDVYEATYREGFDAAIAACFPRTAGTVYPITNSAGEAINDPPFTKELPLLNLNITSNLQTFDAAAHGTWYGVVNDRQFTFSYRGFTTVVKPWKAKITGITPREERWRNKDFWRVRYQLSILMDEVRPEGWRAKYLDEGTSGIIPGGCTGGEVKRNRFLDENFVALTVPQMMDGKGEALIDQTNVANYVWLVWSIQDEKQYSTNSFLNEFITAEQPLP